MESTFESLINKWIQFAGPLANDLKTYRARIKTLSDEDEVKELAYKIVELEVFLRGIGWRIGD